MIPFPLDQLWYLNGAQQQTMLGWMRRCSPDRIEELAIEMRSAGATSYPELMENTLALQKRRHAQYCNRIDPIAGQYFGQLPPGNPVGSLCDCHLQQYVNNTYAPLGPAHQLGSRKSDSLGAVIAVNALHHLETEDMYRQTVAQMLRITKPGGYVVIVEAVHTNWPQQLQNALFDLLLCDRFNRVQTGRNVRVAPVPLTFLSPDGLLSLIGPSNWNIKEVVELAQTPADPMRRQLIVAQRM